VADDDDKARRARAALIDTTVPNPARVGDYLYGGRNNFEADRKIAEAMIAVAPVVASLAPAMRAFHQRAVRYVAAEASVTQFLDIGTSLVVAGGTHEIAQAVYPASRIVYVDDDPVVLAHARALISSTPEGVTRCLDASVRDVSEIIAGAWDTLDFGQPIAVLLLATLTFIADTAAAAKIVASLLSVMVPGSHVVIYHQANDLHPALLVALRRWNLKATRKVTLRSRAEVGSLVAGLDLVPPGMVPICEWRPACGDPRFEDIVPVYGVVARKP
jgi:hypothetical protein